ncbi:MAG: glyoxalase [Robiginitomaculum sp.]|nr:MAG: glyoxalase [Robiginitomaculum sp.]
MVKLEHANLVVDDIQPTLDFLLAAFPHWRVRQSGLSHWNGTPRKWLHVGDDQTYLTLNDNGQGAPRDLAGNAPGLAHLGFTVHGIEALIERLDKKGYAPSSALEQQFARKNVYFTVESSGLEFEFVEYLSDDPAERNASPELN